MNVIDNFLEKMNNLPMLPKVVQEVIQLLNKDNVDIKAVAENIHHDQVLAARVLRMSNSAYFGCSRAVKTIEDAISLIGTQNLKTLVVASGVTATFASVPGLDLKRFWQHSLITASIARQLGKELGFDPEVAYISGLMHTIGQLPIHLVFPETAGQVEEVCKGKSVLERKGVEQSIVGLDHCQVGEKVAKLWKFPEEILHVIRYYAEPLHPDACNLAPVVYTAAHIAFDLEQGKEPRYIAETLNADVAKRLTLTDIDYLSDKIDTYRHYVAEARSYM